MRISSDFYNFNDSKFISMNKAAEIKLFNSLKTNARLNTSLNYELITMIEDLQVNGSEQLKYYLNNPIVREYLAGQKMRHIPQHTFVTDDPKVSEANQELHRYVKQVSQTTKYNNRPAQQTVNRNLKNLAPRTAEDRGEQAMFVLRNTPDSAKGVVNQTHVPTNKVINEYAAALLQNIEEEKKDLYASQIIYEEKDKYITVSLVNIIVFVASVVFLVVWMVR